jgi:hypothetical protein
MTNPAAVSKRCPKCKQVDYTEFSKCRNCGAFYDQAKNVPIGGQPAAWESGLTRNIIGVFLGLGLVAWFVFAAASLNFNSEKWIANRGNDRFQMAKAVSRALMHRVSPAGEKVVRWEGVNGGEARKILGIPDDVQTRLLHKTYPCEVRRYNLTVDQKLVGYYDVWLKDGIVDRSGMVSVHDK